MQNNFSPISNILLECIMYDTLDDPECLLDSLNIDHSNNQDEIEALADATLDKYEFIDSGVDYYDLYERYAECWVVLSYEDNYYKISYTEDDSGCFEINKVEEVEPHRETVTKYRNKCQESISSVE